MIAEGVKLVLGCAKADSMSAVYNDQCWLSLSAARSDFPLTFDIYLWLLNAIKGQ